MERQPHNNLWAEKLLRASMPEGDEAWKDMEAILDRELPQRFWSDRRRWLLLILLLLLLIGVCNCPGRGRLFHGSGIGISHGHTPGAPSAGSQRPGGPANAVQPANPVMPAYPGAGPANPAMTTTTPAVPTPALPSPAALTPAPPTPAALTPAPTTLAARHVHPGSEPPRVIASRRTTATTPAPLTIAHKGKSTMTHRTHRRTKASNDFGDITETGPETGVTKKNIPAGLDTTTTTTTGKDSAAKKNAPSLPKPKPQKDSSHKKSPPPPQEPKEKDHGWVFGAGLNEFFPVGGQNGSTYNSNGLTGTLSDYLPVPMIRYYLGHKAYLQVEAQFNTPQPTPKNLVISKPVPDTSTRSGIFTQITSSASIQQLYYFNIPVSIHFNPWDNLNIGTGLQWSHLTNAIGQFDSSTSISVIGNTPTVVDVKSTHSFKGDTLYRRIRTNEFRILLDVNYTYKHWVLGLRYNQALSKFVDLQLPTGATTQATNSSLQLYLRYILWDTRKKKPVKTP